jgi:hypothetical protein
LLRSAATTARSEVFRLGVWHSAQPMLEKIARPLLIEVEEAPVNELTGCG